METNYQVIVIGGGHAGAEAAWAAANCHARVALITMEPHLIGAMSCNPAIGGLAKGQIVREIDALGGLMGLAADATGIQFRILNASKGPAVQGPRCQSDKYQYAREVQRLLKCRDNIDILQGTVDDLLVEKGQCVGVIFQPTQKTTTQTTKQPNKQIAKQAEKKAVQPATPHHHDKQIKLAAQAVILTTGTFMRGLMHTGESQTPGGRVNEKAAVSISRSLKKLGFDLGRLKTGTPPRLDARTICFDDLTIQPADKMPTAFSDLTKVKLGSMQPEYQRIANRFPVIEQRHCWITHTNEIVHQAIIENLDRAPMYNGQIATTGPRYCPSIEDKVVRFADRLSHHVFLEPESLETDEIYCNGISTSLPSDVQDFIVSHLPGCENAKILRYGYAVEYDMVWPHQIDATCMTKIVHGLFLAGQINGTSGYEEAAAQGLIAGLNAARLIQNKDLVRLQRDQAYIGVMLDDLVTKTPREPYRMFTSRAEHRLLLRADNADERLTPLGREWGLVDDLRWSTYQKRHATIKAIEQFLQSQIVDSRPLIESCKRPEIDTPWIQAKLNELAQPTLASDAKLISKVLSKIKYAGYIQRQHDQIKKMAKQDHVILATDFDYAQMTGLRNEAKATLSKFRPATLGQAARLAGITPADVMVLSVAINGQNRRLRKK